MNNTANRSNWNQIIGCKISETEWRHRSILRTEWRHRPLLIRLFTYLKLWHYAQGICTPSGSQCVRARARNRWTCKALVPICAHTITIRWHTTLKWLNCIYYVNGERGSEREREKSHIYQIIISSSKIVTSIAWFNIKQKKNAREKKLRRLLHTINGMFVVRVNQTSANFATAQFSLFKREDVFCVFAWMCVRDAMRCDVRALCFLNSNRNDYTSTWNKPAVFRKTKKKTRENRAELPKWCMDAVLYGCIFPKSSETLALALAHSHKNNQCTVNPSCEAREGTPAHTQFAQIS